MEKPVESPGKIALEQVSEKARESGFRTKALELANTHGGAEKPQATITRAEAYLKFLKG